MKKNKIYLSNTEAVTASFYVYEYDKNKNCWNVTDFYCNGEDVVFPVSIEEDKPIKTIENKFSPIKKRIKRVTIPEGYISIGESVFKDCTELTDIKLPESLRSIGESAFSNCTGLKDIKLPENLSSIMDSAFEDCIGITKINLPDSLTSIGTLVFNGCTGLTNIKLPEKLTSIYYWTLNGCAKLTSIKLPKSLTTLEPGAFGDCSELADISVDENNPLFCSVDGVLFDKAMTTLIQFPQGKKGVYSVPEGIISIRSGAFDNCKLTGITFPQSLLFIGNFVFFPEQLTDITVNEFNPKYCSIDGVLFNKEMSELIEYPKNKEKTDYAIPDGIISISEIAFNRCKHLVNILLPESIKLIGDGAFEKCKGLKNITLPMDLQFIGEGAFNGCRNLKTVTLSRKTRIGHKAFEGFKGRLVYRD